MSNEEKTKIRQLLEEHETRYKNDAKQWRVGYRAFLILSAFLSASAAVVGKLSFIGNEKLASDFSAILAGLAAVSAAIVASLNFENFWRTNQKARENIKILELELAKEDADTKTIEIINRLQKILEDRAGNLLKDDWAGTVE